MILKIKASSVASVGLTINRAVLQALRAGRFLLSSFFVSFSAMEKEKKKKFRFYYILSIRK
jgi:uncharacterized membrane protein